MIEFLLVFDRIENIVYMYGENSGYQYVHLFSMCLTHSHTVAPFDTPGKQDF